MAQSAAKKRAKKEAALKGQIVHTPLKTSDGPTHEAMRIASRNGVSNGAHRPDQEDRLIELQGRLEARDAEILRLTKENADLHDRIGQSAPRLTEVEHTDTRPWIRGKLPGEVYIKTHKKTGKFYTIDKEEYDALG